MGVKGLKRTKCSCINCHDMVAVIQLDRHFTACLVRCGKFIGRKYPVPSTLNCVHCDKLCKNANSLRQHEIRCSKNPNKISVGTHSRVGAGTGKNQFTKAKELGLPVPFVSKDSIKKGIETKKKNGTLYKTDEQRKTLSESMKQAVREHPESYSSSNRGRCKQIIYDGIKFIGSWEVDFYKWAKSMNLDPQRPINGFPYKFDGDRTYFPDFYLPTIDSYVEVKGYQVDKDLAKWNAFPNDLLVIKSKSIKEIRNGTFTLDKLLLLKYNRS